MAEYCKVRAPVDGSVAKVAESWVPVEKYDGGDPGCTWQAYQTEGVVSDMNDQRKPEQHSIFIRSPDRQTVQSEWANYDGLTD